MHKAIYLTVVVKTNPPGNTSEQVKEIEARIAAAISTTSHELTGTLKRLRVKDGEIKAIVYLEGEQDAPQNFSKIAILDARKSLETAFAVPLTSHSRISISDIQENTNAVDELADEN